MSVASAPASSDIRNEGPNSSALETTGPQPGMSGTANLKSGMQMAPVTMAARAPRTWKCGQKSARISAGQKVAAMPDQPKMVYQKIVRSGLTNETVSAMTSATTASTSVTRRERPVSVRSSRSGRRNFW